MGSRVRKGVERDGRIVPERRYLRYYGPLRSLGGHLLVVVGATATEFLWSYAQDQRQKERV
jgi:hypothetical protein